MPRAKFVEIRPYYNNEKAVNLSSKKKINLNHT